MVVNISNAPLSSSGRTIPLVGFGTAEYPFNSNQNTKDAILNAIREGYRHFDTAAVYFSEKALGEAITEALNLGLIKSRDELFITSKLWMTDAHPHLVLPALQKTLTNLGLQYLDLYLVHFPLSSKPGEMEIPVDKKNLLPLDMENVWRAMEECQKLGLTLSIGVSNFTIKKLETLLETANVVPAVNQVEMNPYWQQKKLRDFCKEKGIHITAYSPLGAKGTPWGTNQVMDSEVLKEIANRRGNSIAQVCLRWVYEQGVSVVVKSYNVERMRENLEIFDWELSSQDLEKINQIPQKRGVLCESFVSEQGPYKSASELWDGDL